MKKHAYKSVLLSLVLGVSLTPSIYASSAAGVYSTENPLHVVEALRSRPASRSLPIVPDIRADAPQGAGCCLWARQCISWTADRAEDAGEYARTAARAMSNIIEQLDAFTEALPEGTLSDDIHQQLRLARIHAQGVRAGAETIAGEAASTQAALDALSQTNNALTGLKQATDLALRHVDPRSEAGAALKMTRTLADTAQKTGILRKTLPTDVAHLRGDHPRASTVIAAAAGASRD